MLPARRDKQIHEHTTHTRTIYSERAFEIGRGPRNKLEERTIVCSKVQLPRPNVALPGGHSVVPFLVLLGFDAPTLGASEFDAARAWWNIVLTSSQAGRAQSSMGEGAFMVVVRSLFQLRYGRDLIRFPSKRSLLCGWK
jgi:hypothetical protein